MPIVSDIILNDGLATPVARTWVPVGNTNGVYKFVYRDTAFNGEPHMDNVMTASLRQQQGSSSYRCIVKFVLPVVHVPTNEGYLGTSEKHENDIVEISFRMAGISTTSNRSDLLAYAASYLAHADATGLVEDLIQYHT